MSRTYEGLSDEYNFREPELTPDKITVEYYAEWVKVNPPKNMTVFEVLDDICQLTAYCVANPSRYVENTTSKSEQVKEAYANLDPEDFDVWLDAFRGGK